MKKIVIIALSTILSAAALSAQDMASATDAYNNASTSLSMGDNAGAIGYFQEALQILEALGDEAGEEGATMIATCRDRIPRLTLQIGKDYIQAKEYDNAVTQLNEAVKVGKEYANEEVVAEATDLIPQVYLQKGNDLIKAKDFAGAAESYRQSVAIDSTNGMASLMLGSALAATGDIIGAEDAYNMAIRNGQQKNAVKQLSNLYLKLSSASLKAKKYEDAVNQALKANEYLENATAMKVAGTASAQLQKNSDAIKYLEQYTLLSPNARDLDDMYYTIAVLAQQSGDTAKACGYYQKITANPKYGETAKAQITALKCN